MILFPPTDTDKEAIFGMILGCRRVLWSTPARRKSSKIAQTEM